VGDAYSRGTVSIIDLLDAQNAALVADQVAANAVYDFLIDLIEVQRASGQLDFLRTPAERSAWLERAETYIEQTAQQPENER
jgi:outer membrane protein TolC